MADIGAIIKFRTEVEGGNKVAELGRSFDGIRDRAVNYAKGLNAAQIVSTALFGATLALSAAQKMMDWGREGAQIAQVTASFEHMNDAVFKTPGLLDQMREASRGTISDMQMMSGVLTLVAGQSDEMAQHFAQAAPQLLEIAKAASALNPTLGDTAFLYESLALGIKRGSPMILDNLGIIVKVGEANEKYAASLGKSVTELTAQEKTIALLNATLESGGKIIEQAGDNIDSATDSYQRWGVSVSGALDAVKESIHEVIFASNALDKVGQGLDNFSSTITESLDLKAAGNELQAFIDTAAAANDLGFEDRMAIWGAAVGNVSYAAKVWRENWQTAAEDVMPRAALALQLLEDGFEGTRAELMAMVDELLLVQPILNAMGGADVVFSDWTPPIEEATTALSEWTDAAKDAALAQYELQSGGREWFAAEQLREAQEHIQGLVDGMNEAEQAAKDAGREIAVGLAEGFQEFTDIISGSFITAIEGLKDIEMPDLFSEGGAADLGVAADSIWSMAQASGAAAPQLADLGVALGEFTPEMAEAAAKAAIFTGAMELLTRDWKMGQISTGDLIASMEEVVGILQDTPVAEIEYVLKERGDRPDFETIPVNVEPQWIDGDPTAMMGGPMKVPAQLDFAGDALSAALDFTDGIPDDQRTIEMLADYTAVETGVEAIATMIQDMETTVVFTDPNVDAVNTAVSKAQSDIQAIDGKVEMYPDAGLVWTEIRALDGKRIPIYVDFIPTGNPSGGAGGSSGGSSGGGSDGRSGRNIGGGNWKVDMNVNFTGPVADPRAVSRSLRSGMDEFYAGIRREGVML